MPAHNLLWEGCSATRDNIHARLAVVPMSQEARGLDAGPRLAARLVGMGDNRSAAVVARISTEERAHVAVGVSWFTQVRVLCVRLRFCLSLRNESFGMLEFDPWCRQLIYPGTFTLSCHDL